MARDARYCDVPVNPDCCSPLPEAHLFTTDQQPLIVGEQEALMPTFK
jgi:hypothetical protein